MQSSKPRLDPTKLAIRIAAIACLALAVFTQNVVGADGAAIPPILFTLTGALVICLL